MAKLSEEFVRRQLKREPETTVHKSQAPPSLTMTLNFSRIILSLPGDGAVMVQLLFYVQFH
jgi:hypothetical protein